MSDSKANEKAAGRAEETSRDKKISKAPMINNINNVKLRNATKESRSKQVSEKGNGERSTASRGGTNGIDDVVSVIDASTNHASSSEAEDDGTIESTILNTADNPTSGRDSDVVLNIIYSLTGSNALISSAKKDINDKRPPKVALVSKPSDQAKIQEPKDSHVRKTRSPGHDNDYPDANTSISSIKDKSTHNGWLPCFIQLRCRSSEKTTATTKGEKASESSAIYPSRETPDDQIFTFGYGVVSTPPCDFPYPYPALHWHNHPGILAFELDFLQAAILKMIKLNNFATSDLFHKHVGTKASRPALHFRFITREVGAFIADVALNTSEDVALAFGTAQAYKLRYMIIAMWDEQVGKADDIEEGAGVEETDAQKSSKQKKRKHGWKTLTKATEIQECVKYGKVTTR